MITCVYLCLVVCLSHHLICFSFIGDNKKVNILQKRIMASQEMLDQTYNWTYAGSLQTDGQISQSVNPTLFMLLSAIFVIRTVHVWDIPGQTISSHFVTYFSNIFYQTWKFFNPYIAVVSFTDKSTMFVVSRENEAAR